MNKVTPTHDLSWYIKWISTVLLLAASTMAAMQQLPLNFLVATVGLAGWTIVGLMWHDRSIIILHAVTTALTFMAWWNHV